MTRSQWAMVVIVLVLIGAMVAVYRAMGEAQDRPSVQRITTVELLEDHAAVFAAYREANGGAWPPDIIALRSFSKDLPDGRLGFTSTLVPHTRIVYRYRPPVGDDPEQAIMASATPNRAVVAGEVYGAKGEVAIEALPPVYYVLTAALEVDSRSAPEDWVVAREAEAAEDD